MWVPHRLPQHLNGLVCRGTHKGRPYAMYVYDSVDVIRHHYEIADSHVWKPVRQLSPDASDHLSGIVQLHFAVLNFAEQAFPSLGYDGHEICPRLAVVVPGKAVGTAAIPLEIALSFHVVLKRPFFLSSVILDGLERLRVLEAHLGRGFRPADGEVFFGSFR